MSPRRRTLCFVFILLSLNNDLDFVTGLPVDPGSPPQRVNSLLTGTSGLGNRVSPEVPQTAFPTQRFNEVFSFGSYPPGLSINTVATTNYGVPKPNSFTTYSTYPRFERLNSLPNVEQITEPYPSNVESLTIVENFPPVTQTIQVGGFVPTANVAEIYQTPITVQTPSLPQLSPFIGVGSSLPEILPSQNRIQGIYTPNVVAEIYPQTIETVTSVPFETTTFNIPSTDIGSSGQQLPVTCQINMASPWNPESVRDFISQPAPAPSPSLSFNPSFSTPPPPIIVIEKSKSKLKSILPILMLTLFDGGCGNNGGGGCSCSQCSASIPIPFPILIPTNNPVITQGSSKASTDAQS